MQGQAALIRSMFYIGMYFLFNLSNVKHVKIFWNTKGGCLTHVAKSPLIIFYLLAGAPTSEVLARIFSKTEGFIFYFAYERGREVFQHVWAAAIFSLPLVSRWGGDERAERGW